jgi:hypothetical protein
MNQFFSNDAYVAIHEIKERLYERLTLSRELMAVYDGSGRLVGRELGYRTGIHEEVMFLERLLDQIEKS